MLHSRVHRVSQAAQPDLPARRWRCKPVTEVRVTLKLSSEDLGVLALLFVKR